MLGIAAALPLAVQAAPGGDAVWQDLLNASRQYLGETQETLERDFQLSEYERWNISQETGELVFTSPDKPDLVAEVVFVGSFAFRSETWLWAWANESVNESLTRKLAPIRKLGEERGFRLLTEPGWTSTQEQGWDMAAVTNYLLRAKGVYRPTSERSVLWVVVTDILRRE